MPRQGRYGFGLRGGPGGQNIVINMMEAFGSPVLHEDGTHRSRPRRRPSPAIDFWAGLMFRDNAAPPSAPNDGFRQIIEGFQTGQTAMIYHHTGSYQDIASKLEAGRAVRHHGDPGRSGQARRASRLRLQHASPSPRTPTPSWEWIKFWGEPDAAVAFLEKTGYFPASTRRGQGRAHRRQPDVRGGRRDARLRHPAAELPRCRRLGRRHRAPGVPARADRRRRRPSRPSTR